MALVHQEWNSLGTSSIRPHSRRKNSHDGPQRHIDLAPASGHHGHGLLSRERPAREAEHVLPVVAGVAGSGFAVLGIGPDTLLVTGH